MRSAIVCMTHCPFYLEDWIQHHQELGFDRIYLRLEGERTGSFLQKLASYPIIRILEYQYYPMGDQMDRQGFLVQNAIIESKKENIDFLLHIDDDELFFLYGNVSLHSFLEKYRNHRDFLHFGNVEAVYPETDQPTQKMCFQKTKKFTPCFKTYCRGYGNGKSMACIRNCPSIQPFGVHFFSGKAVEIPTEEAIILHYESCDYEDWKWKFSKSNPSVSTFPFYKKSSVQLQKYQECLQNRKNEECEADLFRFYKEQTKQQKKVLNIN